MCRHPPISAVVLLLLLLVLVHMCSVKCMGGGIVVVPGTHVCAIDGDCVLSMWATVPLPDPPCMHRNNRLIVAVAPGITLYQAPRRIENSYYMLTVSTAPPDSDPRAVVADPLSLVVRVVDCGSLVVQR